VYKFSLKLIEALGLVYIYLLIFMLYFIYIIRVNKVFTKVVNHLSSYLKGVSSIRLILSI
jgi:hypothetical protein